MNKIFTVARTEYAIAVTSKAFILGVIMMPVLMGGAFLVQYLAEDQVDLTPRTLAVIDETGALFETIRTRAEMRNESAIFRGEGSDREQIDAPFRVEKAEPSDSDDRVDVELSRRVKDDQLFAFAIIEKDVFTTGSGGGIRYYSQTPSYTGLPDWLNRVVDDEVKRSRAAELGLSPADIAAIAMPTPLRQFGLVELGPDGEVTEAKEENRALTLVIPLAGVMLIFMMVMTVAPAMLNNVLEEKIQKISEFLVSSVTPFQLMMGKLIGSVGVGLTLSTIYLGAAYSLARYFDIADRIPLSLYAWFALFLLVAMVIYGSMFSAIGAACSEIRDAQSLMTPVMLVVMIPMVCLSPILNSPSSVFAKVMSLIPPATPMLMFARIAIPPGPAVWELVLGTILTILFATGSIFVAGKIFRIGILSQGQTPTFGKMIGWVFAK